MLLNPKSRFKLKEWHIKVHSNLPYMLSTSKTYSPVFNNRLVVIKPMYFSSRVLWTNLNLPPYRKYLFMIRNESHFTGQPHNNDFFSYWMHLHNYGCIGGILRHKCKDIRRISLYEPICITSSKARGKANFALCKFRMERISCYTQFSPYAYRVQVTRVLKDLNGIRNEKKNIFF